MVRVVLLASLFASIGEASAVEVDDLTKCRAVTDVAARANCYDRLVDAAVERGEKTVVNPSSQSASSKPAPAEKTVALAKATRGGSGRLLFATTEGEMWAQTEGEPLATMPEAGASVTIKRGVLGGYFCSLDRHTSFRCSQRKD